MYTLYSGPDTGAAVTQLRLHHTNTTNTKLVTAAQELSLSVIVDFFLFFDNLDNSNRYI